MTGRLRVAVVGATGLVGQEMLRTLEARRFPVADLLPFASSRSAGKTVQFDGNSVPVIALTPDAFSDVDVALFSAGGSVSREWAPVAARAGTLVVDNSSAFRMDPEVPLVVPEVNLDHARRSGSKIIANPNCSTIQMVLALKPLHDEARIRRIFVATYQAISGAGATACQSFRDQLMALAAGKEVLNGALPGQLAGNLLMSWTPDVDSGYQEEELKMVRETQKILDDPGIRVSPTTVRVPVLTGHAEAIAIETERALSPGRARELLAGAPGVRVVDDFANGVYPTPLDAAGEDDVLVGRIRQDTGNPDGIQLWVVGDNLRKGAALNAVQIAEALLLQ